MHGGFGLEQGLASARFNGRPDPFGSAFQQPPAGNMSHFPYDMNAAQTWNSPAPPMGAFGNNGMGAMGQNGDLGASRTVKPRRGRAGLNNVCSC